MSKKPNNPNTLSDEAKKRLAKRREERKQKRNQEVEPAEWIDADSDLVLALIDKFTARGGVISFSYTRDGGAYRVGYYIDGESDAVYIRPTENIDTWLDEEVAMWELTQ